MPLHSTPSSLSLFFAAGVTRRRFCDGSGLEQRGRQRWPHVGMQRSALRCVRGRACAGLASRGVVGRAQPRTSSIAQLSERLPARQKIEPSPGRCRASCAPIRSPPGSGSSLVCRVPAAVVGEHGDVEVGDRGSRRGQVTRRASSRVHRETTPLPAASKQPIPFAQYCRDCPVKARSPSSATR